LAVGAAHQISPEAAEKKQMPSILFVCTANQFRSPLAAACLLAAIKATKLTGDWNVESAGTWTKAGLPAPELSRKIASKLGVPLPENHRTRQVNQALLAEFDLIIVMEAGQKEALWIEFPALKKRIYMLSETVEGLQYDFPDPVAPGIDPFDVAYELKMAIEQGLEKITQLATSISVNQ
jgi:protein-tyrosine phosphatase